ncbi:hypothetical protein [Escherichia coli]|uniref:hypothetical protein n=1 Tax=Escherichia coli TaxID=562 RepID=UPI00201D0143|nr:hypothetical protein [Escherichia coli]
MSKIHNPVVLINRPDNSVRVVAITDGSQNYQDARLMASMELDIAGDGADTWSRVGYYMATEIEALRQRIAELEAREVQLPIRYDLRYGHPINADKRHVMIPEENGSWLYLIDLEHALRVAGIRIKGE